jgi:hypothetical protein
MNKKQSIIIAASSIIILIAILFSPITVPLNLTVRCKVKPVHSWIAKLGTDGNVSTTMVNSKTGAVENYFSAIPERGDSYSFELNIDKLKTGRVENGDTIGSIKSNLTAGTLAELNSRLVTAKGTLKLLITGEKESLVRYAQEQVKAAEERAEYFKALFQRKKELFEDGSISEEEMELHRTSARQAAIEVAVQQANLESIQTGSKTEQISLIRNEIRAIEEEIEVVKKKLASFTIISPMSGIISAYNSADTILTISSENMLLMIPINWNFNSILREGLAVKVENFEGLKFHINSLRAGVHIINGQQTVIAIAETDQVSPLLMENLWLKCTINFGDFSIFDFIKWKLLQTYEVN